MSETKKWMEGLCVADEEALILGRIVEEVDRHPRLTLYGKCRGVTAAI